MPDSDEWRVMKPQNEFHVAFIHRHQTNQLKVLLDERMQLVQLIYDFYQPDQRYFPDLTKRLTKKQINLQYRKQFTC